MPLPERRFLAVSAFIYALVALLSTRIPLLNYLGFEFSVLMGVVGSLEAGFLAVTRMRREPMTDQMPPASRVQLLRSALRWILTWNLLLLAVPLVVITANAAFVRNCSILEGAAFFLLIPVVSVVFSSCLGVFCAAHFRWARAAFVVLAGVSVLYAAGLGYWTPAIFSYNPFYGFFPGLTYDELVIITPTLVLSRVLTLALATVLVWFTVLLARWTEPSFPGWKKLLRLLEVLVRPGVRWVTAAIVLVFATVWVFRCELGLESTSGYVKTVLGGVFHTERVTLYYNPHAQTHEEIQRIARDHEFSIDRILTAFALPRTGRVVSFVYPDERTKARLMGAGRTTIAKPWNRELHVAREDLEATLHHELVHVVAGEFGLPVLNASPSMGLVEGLAMAVDWDWGNRTLHQYAASMRDEGVGGDIEGLMTVWGFASRHASVSYVQAGSFCRYLMDRYGIRTLVHVYRDADYEAVYGRSLGELMEEWHRFLDEVSRGVAPRDNVDALFRRPPIFQKVCARVMARRMEEAREAMRRKEYERAREIYTASLGESGAYEALQGSLAAEFRVGAYRQVAHRVDSLLHIGDHPGMYLPLLLLGSDARWALDEMDSARSLCRRLAEADILETLTEAARVRLRALDEDRIRPYLLAYFLSDAGDSVRLMILDSAAARAGRSPTGAYLAFITLQRMGRYEAASAMADSCSFASTDPVLEALRLRRLGQVLFRLGRHARARETFWESLNFNASPVAQHRVNEWIDRTEWSIRHGH